MPSEPALSLPKGRGAAFFASPGKWLWVWCHDENGKWYQVPIDGSEVTCHDEIVSVTSKKQGAIRQLAESADSANDAVPVDETVRVPQDLINGKEFKGIEFGIDYKSVLALATVPAEAASVQINKF